MMHGYSWNDMGAWGWIGMLMMVLFWSGLVVLIVWAIIGTRPGRAQGSVHPSDGDPALAILRERYARGEMTTDEFNHARMTLESRTH
jgi:putative membrane protein